MTAFPNLGTPTKKALDQYREDANSDTSRPAYDFTALLSESDELRSLTESLCTFSTSISRLHDLTQAIGDESVQHIQLDENVIRVRNRQLALIELCKEQIDRAWGLLETMREGLEQKPVCEGYTPADAATADER